MDNQRLLLFIGLSFVMLLLWQAWMEDYGPPPQAEVPVAMSDQAADMPAGTPLDASTDTTDLPSVSGELASMDKAMPETALLKNAQYIDVETDLFHIKIDTTGGDLRQADLLAYPATTAPDSPPFRLLNDSMPNLFVIQSGLRASVGTEPTHHVVYTPEQSSYRMADGDDELHPQGSGVGSGIRLGKGEAPYRFPGEELGKILLLLLFGAKITDSAGAQIVD